MNKLDKNDEIIIKSKKRCTALGVKKQDMPLKLLDSTKFSKIMESNHQLVKIAKPFMEIIYNFLKGSGFSLYITDKGGVILSIIGDKDIIEAQAKTGIEIGTDMSEESCGTNAIGTALYEDCSIQISGDEHFIIAFQVWTCSASVIHGIDGSIIGCLNLTGRYQAAHSHTLGLVVAAVKSIENQLRAEKTQNELYNAYKYLNKIMDSVNLGILAADTTGEIKAINNILCSMLNVKEENILNKKANTILANWEYIFDCLKTGKSYENKEVVYFLNGVRKRFNMSVYPIKDTNEVITGLVAIYSDMKKVYNLVGMYTRLPASYTFDYIIGESDPIVKLKEQAQSVSNSPSTILIQGESGTGKELFAQSIHNSSSRRNNNFVAINCGAIPKNLIESELFGYEEGAFTGAKKGIHYGKFEQAHEGTLFLDEIGEMPLDMQVSLLRVLQEGCVTRLGGNQCIMVDVRIIAATNKELEKEVAKGTFREDLYYRLSVIPLYVPPLRKRGSDIELLIKYFLKSKAVKLGKPIPKISSDLYEKLLHYQWPGNVREMENCIENIVNLDGKTSFSFVNKSNNDYNELYNKNSNIEYDMCSLEEWEQKAIISCIEKCNGNITMASKILGINRSTIYSKIKGTKKNSIKIIG